MVWLSMLNLYQKLRVVVGYDHLGPILSSTLIHEILDELTLLSVVLISK